MVDIFEKYPTMQVNYNDLTVLPHWESCLIREIIPKWPYFRLVNYYNAPSHMQEHRIYTDVSTRISNIYGCIIIYHIYTVFVMSIYDSNNR